MDIGVIGLHGVCVLYLVEEAFRLITDPVTIHHLYMVVSFALGIHLIQEHAIEGDVQ